MITARPHALVSSDVTRNTFTINSGLITISDCLMTLSNTWSVILVSCLLQQLCVGRSKLNNNAYYSPLLVSHNIFCMVPVSAILCVPFVDMETSTLIQLNDCTCLGYIQIFECTVFGGGFTIWRGTALSNCQQNEIRLRHSQYMESQVTRECNAGAIVAKSMGTSGNCYTSQLTVAVGEKMINKTVECVHSDSQGANTIIGQNTLSLTQGKTSSIL